MRAAFRWLQSAIAAIAGWRFFKPAVFIACAIPLVLLAHDSWKALSGRDPDALGADPVKLMLHETGETALALLLITLSVTPARRIFGVNRLISVRRMLGVWSFVYALAHLSVYLVFDQLCYSLATCELNAIVQDILKRRFILVGQLAFFCLLLLAITSTSGWVRRLRKNWARLHRLAYVAAAAGIIHFIWIQKSDISEPLNWAIWFVLLMLFRVFWAIKRRLPEGRKPVNA